MQPAVSDCRRRGFFVFVVSLHDVLALQADLADAVSVLVDDFYLKARYEVAAGAYPYKFLVGRIDRCDSGALCQPVALQRGDAEYAELFHRFFIDFAPACYYHADFTAHNIPARLRERTDDIDTKSAGDFVHVHDRVDRRAPAPLFDSIGEHLAYDPDVCRSHHEHCRTGVAHFAAHHVRRCRLGCS